MTELESPFKGLAAFEDSELDGLLFFGRERDAQVIEANLVAARLTVLYGTSGVGKSSVVQAAVARALRGLREEPLVVVWSGWGRDPATSLAHAVAEAAGTPTGPLADVVERAQQTRPVYLILDQAEEYFVYHGADDSFERALADILSRHARANILLVVRDDALAGLDRFRRHLPGVFGNVVRLGRLDRAAGAAAIVRPVERFRALTGEELEVERSLVDCVLDEVAVGRIEIGLGGEGVGGGGPPTDEVETPYLQLVMQRVWEAERAEGSHVLRLETLERLGGARKVVADNLERAMAELTPSQRAIAAAMFTHLVTPSGQKVAHRPVDLAELAGVPEPEATAVLRALHDRRILRSHEGGRFEIFHDVLASEILEWRRRFEAEEALEAQRRAASRRHHRLLLVTLGALAAALVATGLTVWALVERGNASEQARRARGRELDATAIATLQTDPELGMLLAAEAARLSPTPSAEDVLRRAILSSHLVQSLPAGAPVTDIAVSGPRLAVGTATGGVRVFARRRDGTYASELAIRTTGYVRQVAVDADALAAVTVGGAVRIVTGSRTVSRSVPAPVGGAILVDGCSSPGGCVVVGSRRDLRVLDAATGAGVERIALPSRIDEIVAVRGSVVAVRSADRSVRLVDIGSRRVRALAAPGAVRSLAASARLVAAGTDDGWIRVWDAATGRQVGSRKQHVNAVLAIAVARDVVLSGAASGTAQAWDLRQRTVTAPPGGHNNLVVAVDITADAAYATTASLDRTARVWRTKDGYVTGELVGHRDGVRDVGFADRGRQVVTGSADGTVAVWDSGTVPDLRVTREPAPSLPRTRARSADGAVATADGAAVRLELPSGQTVVLAGHRDSITSVAFSEDGARLVTASRDHDARIWDARSGRLLQVLAGHFGAVSDARFSPDGRWVVTAGPITAGLWNARTGELVRFLRGPQSLLTAAAFTDDRTIVTSEADGTTRKAVCGECGTLADLVAIADTRLTRTGRQFTPQERERFLR